MHRDGNLAERVALLDSVAEISNQRALARKIGISVGLANALVRRAVSKGLVKISEAPARRFAYYLTPSGFMEKSRLVAEYLDFSLSFFRLARQDYGQIFARCLAMGHNRIVLCGAGELAEIATLAASGTDVELVAVLDSQTNHERFAGLKVIRSISETGPDHVFVVSDGRNPQDVYDGLMKLVGAERVHAPPFLRVTAASRPGSMGTR